MLPNSRIVTPTQQRQRSNSAATSYETKRSFLSRFLATPSSPVRPKYESVLGIQNDKDYELWGRSKSKKGSIDSPSHDHIQLENSISNNNRKSKGFSKLFKKKTKTSDDNLLDNQPKVRPAKPNKIHSKIPLAPPPNYPRNRAFSQPDQFIAGLPSNFSITSNNDSGSKPSQKQVSPPPSFNTANHSPNEISTKRKGSTNTIDRKSSGSYSIYSTFGADSVYSVEHQVKPSTVASTANSVQWDSTSSVTGSVDSFNTVLSTTESTTENDEDVEIDEFISVEQLNKVIEEKIEEEDEDDDDDDAFVDATGFSQDDIEKEKQYENLSKRLSGGHFGSAGGLILSISPTVVPSYLESSPSAAAVATEATTKQQRRKSRPPPDDIAQSMLNWKRHSDGSKRWSSVQIVDPTPDKRPSSQITVIDIRSSTPQTTRKEDIEKKEEKELSIPDKIAFRQAAEKTLMGSKKQTSTTQETNEFSKTLDNDVWKTEKLNIIQVKDPRNTINVEEQSLDMSEVKKTADLLWKEDETIVPRSKVAEWLGQGKPFRTAVLKCYMNYFYFAGMRLESAFRKLCSKLYFKAEAQQIDRILESFAHRYWDCNTDCLFGSVDVVYAVVYSLLLLNTDLHVAQGNHARMTRSEFIRNTMSTIRDQRDHEVTLGHRLDVDSETDKAWESEVENYLKEMYLSVKQYQILQPLSRQPSVTRRTSILGGKRVVGLKKSVNSIIRKSGRESMILEDQTRTSFSSGYTGTLTPSLKSPRRESFSSLSSSASLSSRGGGSPVSGHHYNSFQPLMQYMNSHSSSLFTSQPPYFKEGVVMRKHLLESASQKAKHREWKECFLEVGNGGELRIYALQGSSAGEEHRRSVFRHSSVNFNTLEKSNLPTTSSSFGGATGGKWASHSQLLSKIQLNHTLANALPPPGYNRQRPFVFAIQEPDGGVYLFQAVSADEVNEWVSTCNYWAARESKEPLPGVVGNMEYGWGKCLDDVILNLDTYEAGDSGAFIGSDPDNIIIHDWQPPSATLVSSKLSEKEQFEQFQKHLNTLNNDINEHRDLKSKIMIKFPSKCHNHVKAMTNWEAKSKYLLHDIIKFQNYCDTLEKSIQKKHEIANSDARASKLIYQENKVDLFKEISEELHLEL
ncbi:hypothetical protein K501DRAFT_337592 [Backusella circina FSU 941]|nr:hypothetical protein K501DRAFT_337592 [Backusella circina FSU 941]